MAKNATSATAPRGVVGHAAIARIDASHRLRGREHVPGDDDERHLQRERDQLPEASAPGVDHLQQARRRQRDAGDDDDERAEQREDERIGHPALGPVGERERHAREQARVGVGVGNGGAGRRGYWP